MKNKKTSSGVPLYLRIYSDLKQRIEDSEWGYGAMLPSEIELGQSYNISRGTVRQVLAKLEDDEFVRRERGRGTFITYNKPTSQPSSFGNHTISFIAPYVRDSYVSSILLGLEREARSNGYAVVFNHVENDLDKQEQALSMALRQGVTGVILYPVNSSFPSPALRQLIAQKRPLVLVDRYIRGVNADYVSSDNFGGGLIATQHLLELGHTRVAFLSWREPATTMEHRRAGYRQALLEAGLNLDPQLEWEVIGYPEIDQEALEEYLCQKERPSAVFAANDQLAIALQRSARKLNIRIPEELALVGFDDLDISAHLDIPLTTVAQPAFEIGRTAWQILERNFTQEDIIAEKRLLPVKLIIRQSCGAINFMEKR